MQHFCVRTPEKHRAQLTNLDFRFILLGVTPYSKLGVNLLLRCVPAMKRGMLLGFQLAVLKSLFFFALLSSLGMPVVLSSFSSFSFPSESFPIVALHLTLAHLVSCT